MKYLIRITIFALVLLLLVSVLSLYMVLRPGKLVSDTTPADLGLDYERVDFETEDGVELAGWFIPTTGGETNTTVIAMHGYPADKGNILFSVSELAEDYNLFLFDFRYLGESGGWYSTAGAKETRDLKAAVALLEDEYSQESFGLWGFSVGGAVAIMTASDLPQVGAIYAESSYANLGDLSQELYRTPLIGAVMGKGTNLLGGMFLGVNPSNVAPEEDIKHIDIPVMIVHSRDDRVIDFSHGERLAEAGGESVIFVEENGLNHGQATDESKSRMREFFEANL